MEKRPSERIKELAQETHNKGIDPGFTGYAPTIEDYVSAIIYYLDEANSKKEDKNGGEEMSRKKFIKQDHIASDDCSFCGTHESCGHYFRAVKAVFGGYEDERGSYILINTCGDYSWICKDCWEKIKRHLL